MKSVLNGIILLGVAFIAACGDDDEEVGCKVDRLQSRTALAVISDYQSSVLVAFSPDCAGSAVDVAILSGDAVVRKLDDNRAVALNRGLTASNLLVVDADLQVSTQIDLPGCGPHDAVLLDDGRVFVTCYEDDAARVVNLETAALVEVDLSSFADADGLPEMDAVTRIDNTLYVTMQVLDRTVSFLPVGAGRVAAVNASTLTIDRSFELPCQNPFSNFVGYDNAAYVACAGDYAANLPAVARIDANGVPSVAVSSELLGGTPSDNLAIDADGALGIAVAYYKTDGSFQTDRMEALRIAGDSVSVLYQLSGYSLGGVAFADRDLLVGNRSADGDQGIYRVDAAGATTRLISARLPPANIVVF